jgi:hypothetical protein
MAEGKQVTVKDLELDEVQASSRFQPAFSERTGRAPAILRALSHANGKISEAAELLRRQPSHHVRFYPQVQSESLGKL